MQHNYLLLRSMTLIQTGSTVSCEYMLCTGSVDCGFAGWPVWPTARTALSDRARAGGVRGLWTLTIWPLGGWFPHWLPLFPPNNWDLIWEEISKDPVTPLLRSDRFPSLALKETSPSHDALWTPWVVGVCLCDCGILTFLFLKHEWWIGSGNTARELDIVLKLNKWSDLHYFPFHRFVVNFENGKSQPYWWVINT